ncbi:hypothetical protein [Rhodoferax sp. U11-2br]|uniref:hypothetical protein n=1 Tax=Rhodoferax sp. U11-2br TaxID=2838878 RepID=UPI001BE79490|nr:hypothetical protein [Rhodoferax sp. U11-2br]MBT3067048.1 hypothetical protein [Rhodoferax sp. U11-2br]
MLIINDKPGQMCNCLWSYAPYIAFARENNIKVALPHFYKYSDLFFNLNNTDGVIVKAPFQKLGTAKTLYFFYKIFVKLCKTISKKIDLKNLSIYLNFSEWEKECWPKSILLKKNALVFVGSWNGDRDNDIFLKNKKYIVNLFKPEEKCSQEVDAVFYELRKNYDLVIGLHVRRGDYKTFIDGRYYFDDVVYANFVKQLAAQMPSRRLITYIASNETIDISSFNGLAVHYVPSSSPLTDLESLGRCDYILGPPSTFSMWASFVGDKPLLFLKNKTHLISLADFSPILYQDTFRNGNIFSHDY